MIEKINYKKGKRFDFGTHINEFLIPREKAKSSETFLVIINPKKSTHLHKHPDMEQVFFVTKGRGVLWTKTKKALGGKLKKRCDIKFGDVLFIPINDWHQISCTSKERLEYLCFNAFPSGHLPGEPTALAHAAHVKMIQKKKAHDKKTKSA